MHYFHTLNSPDLVQLASADNSDSFDSGKSAFRDVDSVGARAKQPVSNVHFAVASEAPALPDSCSVPAAPVSA
jgi:hypothetical protein